MFGLFKKKVDKTEDIIDGGITNNTDYSAPKTIQSTEITSFYSSFYRMADNYYDVERKYSFHMDKSTDNKYYISEGKDENLLQCETDNNFAVALDKLIRDYHLASNNGVSKVTAGLPPEYGPWELLANYASNERLHFYENGDPIADWTRAVLDLFANEFAKRGIIDLLPVKETSKITRFSISFAYDEIMYTYGEIYVPITKEAKRRSIEEVATLGYDDVNYAKKAYTSKFNRKKGKIIKDNRLADLTEKHYATLQKIAEEYDIKLYNNGEIYPSDFDCQHTEQYYEFYIEYENGNRLNGFSADTKQCNAFNKLANAYKDYYENYLDGKF